MSDFPPERDGTEAAQAIIGGLTVRDKTTVSVPSPTLEARRG